MKRKYKYICTFFTAVLLAALCYIGLTWRNTHSSSDSDHIRVYLWNSNLLKDYVPYIQSQFPDVTIDFIAGNNDLDFYQFLAENDDCPDIITNRRFSLHDAQSLDPYLMDLSGTEAAASIYTTYLENYRKEDGTVNWLPICGEVDCIVANQDLFEQYGIDLPTDYDSFISACQAFEAVGIQGFMSDFSMDYTCLEILQGFSISELTSLEGKLWRQDYESGGSNLLDDEVWPVVFQNMESFLEDAAIPTDAADYGYNAINTAFLNGEIAMIRETGNAVLAYPNYGLDNCVMLPYFGKEESENWLLTYPSFQIALSDELSEDTERRELALDILDVMLSAEAQQILASNGTMISYGKNVELQLADALSSIQPYVSSNRQYIRIASNDFFSTSLSVVHKMITKEYDAQEAYEAFNELLSSPSEETEETVITLETGYEYAFDADGGNPALSSVANTLREALGSDLLLAPCYTSTSSIYAADYTEEMLGYIIASNNPCAYTRELTGSEIRELVRCCVEGSEDALINPFNETMLPASSGFELKVAKTDTGFTLKEITISGEPLRDDDTYTFTYVSNTSFASGLLNSLFESDGGTEAFDRAENTMRKVWTDYLLSGNQPAEPTDYISLT